MRPDINMDELILAVEKFESNQISKILKLQATTQDLKAFLTIDNSIITPKMQTVLDNMEIYIDKNSELYKQLKGKYEIQSNIQDFINRVEKLFAMGKISDDIGSKLIKSQNFRDVLTSSIVGQFPNTKKGEARFNNKDFNTKIQQGAKAEVTQIIKRVIWAQAKSNDKLQIEVEPVGSTGAPEDIMLTFNITGPRGGKTKTTLREDVKTALNASYLKSGSIPFRMKEIITKAAKNSPYTGNKWYIKVNSDEMYNVVAELLGQKYGVVYNQKKWVANSAIFFTSPDNSIEMGSELLKRKDFQIVVNDTITKMAIRQGYINNSVGKQ